jgi:peptidoglycan hydrolase-like protein with peptidoglycan-binding domain
MAKRVLAVIVVLGFLFSTINISLAGESVKDIEKWQSDLAKLGYYKSQPTGKMDEATIQAIKECQKKCGMEPTGKLDKNTCAAIEKELQKQSAPGEKGGDGEAAK